MRVRSKDQFDAGANDLDVQPRRFVGLAEGGRLGHGAVSDREHVVQLLGAA